METQEIFQQLKKTTCTFCGHDVEENEDTSYRNVCKDCFDVLDEE